MALSRDEEKPWKTDLARKSAQRREQVLHDVEEVIRKAPSFEEALRQSLDPTTTCVTSPVRGERQRRPAEGALSESERRKRPTRREAG